MRKGETYPESIGKLDQLFENGEVWMSMSYNPVHAANMVNLGRFPVSTKTFLMEQGTLANTHYLSIPFNAKSKAGAMIVIDFLLSPSAQITKFDLAHWGDGMAISTDALTQEEVLQLNRIDRGAAALPPEILEKGRIPEISADYVDLIEKGWMDNVAKN